MKTLGLCAGASTISIIGLEKKDSKIIELEQKTLFHDGDSKGTIEQILNSINIDNYDRICVTGRKFRNFINLTSITEPEAVEYSVNQLIEKKDQYNALISAGGETIIVYELSNKGKIYNVFTGNKCASGTGEFFLQQLGRMALTVGELEERYNEEEAYD
ncbi:MAG: activase, partial [Spirochaetes bacterium]|nr:activase [Spirochaetota bacterium]